MCALLSLRQSGSLHGLTVYQVVRRTWERMNEHEVLTRGAAIAFYAMSACVPFLALLLSVLVQLLPDLTGLAGHRTEVGGLTVSVLRTSLRHLFPTDVYEVVEDQIARLQEETARSSPALLMVLGLGGTLWLASSVYIEVMAAMNRIYGVRETRSWAKLRLVAAFMTIVQAAIFLGALLTIVVGPEILRWLHIHWHLAVAVVVTQWLITVVIVVLSFALTLYVAPNAGQGWSWISPGSVFGTVTFLLSSLLFRVYVQNFANYHKVYGSLGGVMALMFWFWITAIVLLMAGELNQVLENGSRLGSAGAETAERSSIAGCQAELPAPVGESIGRNAPSQGTPQTV
jgi:membrane protein